MNAAFFPSGETSNAAGNASPALLHSPLPRRSQRTSARSSLIRTTRSLSSSLKSSIGRCPASSGVLSEIASLPDPIAALSAAASLPWSNAGPFVLLAGSTSM